MSLRLRRVILWGSSSKRARFPVGLALHACALEAARTQGFPQEDRLYETARRADSAFALLSRLPQSQQSTYEAHEGPRPSGSMPKRLIARRGSFTSKPAPSSFSPRVLKRRDGWSSAWPTRCGGRRRRPRPPTRRSTKRRSGSLNRSSASGGGLKITTESGPRRRNRSAICGGRGATRGIGAGLAALSAGARLRAGTKDLDLGRARYLKIVWTIAQPPEADPYYYYG